MVNKKILMSLVLMTCFLGLASAGTFAYFADTQSTSANTITTGTLKLNDITQVQLAVTNAIPGDLNKNIGSSFALTNTGSTSGILTATMTDITGASAFGNDIEINILKQDGTLTPIYKNGAAIPVTLSGNFLSGATFNEYVQYTYIKTTVVQDQQNKVFGFKLQYELRQAP